ASHLDNDVTSQFRNKRLGGLRTESDILNFLQRTYKVNIHNMGSAASPEIVVDVGVDYKYLIPGEIVAGITAEPGSGPEEYKEEAQTIFDSKDTEHNPRNVFIFYVPNYASRAGGTVLDNFEINNDEDLDVNVYLIRTEQTESVAFGTDNKTTFERERDYAANVMINEKDDAKINTAIRTNLEDNLTKDYDDADRKRSPSHISYNIDIPGSTKLAELRTAFSSETVDASEEESRKYDVEIKVYRGKSGGSGDNNGYINYDGAAENGFPKEDILTTFTGSLVQ
ncbi:MAG: hypothetical protein IJ711_03325, partial [Lachnospiraceae bacterium]|nr:hypothetical protein [Lachnospiraceae bacterium]